MHGKWLTVDSKQYYMEPPSNNVASIAPRFIEAESQQSAPFFEGAGRPSKPFWGPQQERRVILWESLRPEDQEKCLTQLQSDRHWVIWCKVKPKDIAAQLFREYGKCIFVGKCTRLLVWDGPRRVWLVPGGDTGVCG